MAIKNNQLSEAGFTATQVKLLRALVAEATGGSVAWASVTGTQTGVEAAVKAKPAIAALTGSSTAADIVTALKA